MEWLEVTGWSLWYFITYNFMVVPSRTSSRCDVLRPGMVLLCPGEWWAANLGSLLTPHPGGCWGSHLSPGIPLGWCCAGVGRENPFLVGMGRLELQLWDFAGTAVGTVPLQPERTAALQPVRSLPKTVTGFVLILCPEMSQTQWGSSWAMSRVLWRGTLTLDLCCSFRFLSASGYTVSN